MTPRQIALIRETWQQVAPTADQAAALFYRRLFELDPSLRELFTNVDIAAQGKKLAKALDDLVANLDHVEYVVPALEVMGRRHVAYGVRDQHYETVGDALLWTLERDLGESWTPEAKAAWLEAYKLVVKAMRGATLPGQNGQHSDTATQHPA